jgi:hypothetical protein
MNPLSLISLVPRVHFHERHYLEGELAFLRIPGRLV